MKKVLKRHGIMGHFFFPCQNPLMDAYMTLHTLPTCDMSLGLLTTASSWRLCEITRTIPHKKKSCNNLKFSIAH